MDPNAGMHINRLLNFNRLLMNTTIKANCKLKINIHRYFLCSSYLFFLHVISIEVYHKKKYHFSYFVPRRNIMIFLLVCTFVPTNHKGSVFDFKKSRILELPIIRKSTIFKTCFFRKFPKFLYHKKKSHFLRYVLRTGLNTHFVYQLLVQKKKASMG